VTSKKANAPPIYNAPKPYKALSKRAQEGLRVREENQEAFMSLVVDAVTKAIRKYIPSLDWEQGGQAADDIESNPALKQSLLQIRLKGFPNGSRQVLIRGKIVVKEMKRFPTPTEMREAVRLSVDELKYIRKEIIAAEGDGVSGTRKVKKPITRKKKVARIKKPLKPPTITARAKSKRPRRFR
jgi:hypothetical protein